MKTKDKRLFASCLLVALVIQVEHCQAQVDNLPQADSTSQSRFDVPISLSEAKRLKLDYRQHFSDRKFLTVDGAVRKPDLFFYNFQTNLLVSRAIILAGGVTESNGTFSVFVIQTKPNSIFVKENTVARRITAKEISNIKWIVKPGDEIQIRPHRRTDFQ